MIVDPRYFFGRGEQLDRVFEKLNARQPQSCNVLGEHRIGRSSFLYRVKTIAPEKLNRPASFLLAYLDLQLSGFATPDGFRCEVLNELGCRTSNLSKPVEATQFETELAKFNNKGITPVLLLDEFEGLLKPDRKYDANFFDGLRALASKNSLVYVIATQKPLKDIEKTTPNLSKLYTVCDNRVKLDNLKPDEAQALLSQSSEFPLNQAQIDLALDWAGEPHPLKLNLAANAIYAQLALNNSGWGPASISEARGKAIKRLNYHFSPQKRKPEGFWTSAWKWLTTNLIDRAEFRKWFTLALPVLVFLLFALCLGLITIPQVVSGVLQKIGMPSPTPIPTP